MLLVIGVPVLRLTPESLKCLLFMLPKFLKSPQRESFDIENSLFFLGPAKKNFSSDEKSDEMFLYFAVAVKKNGATTLSLITLSIMIFIIMTLSIMTLIITKLSLTTLSIMTLSIRTLSIMTLSITTLNIMTLSIMTLSIMTLSIMTLSINDHSA